MSRFEFDPITHEPFRQEPLDLPSGTELPKWNPLDRAEPERPIAAMGQDEDERTVRLIRPRVGL